MNPSPSSDSGLLDLARRCRALFGGLGTPTVVALPDAPPPADAGWAPLVEPHVSVEEAFLPLAREERNAYDHVAVLAVEADPAAAGAPGPAQVHVIGRDAFRSHAAPISSGILIGGIPVAPLGAEYGRLSAALFRIRRSTEPRRISEARRIVEALESLAAALDYARDPAGSLGVAWSVLDRVELLSRAPGVSLLLRRTHDLARGPRGGHLPQHLAFLAGGEDDARRRFRVKDGRLCAVKRSASREGDERSPEAAEPWREQGFLLVRVGPAPEGKDQRRSIDQLRREYALTRPSAAAEAQAPEVESYHDRANRLRLTARLTALYGQAGVQRLPAVTPIAVEAAGSLRPLLLREDGELAAQFAQRLAGLRGGLSDRFGLDVPSVRLRINETDMPEGSYLIMLREVPLVMGTLTPDQGLCNATVADLAPNAIRAEEAVNPADGSACSWVARRDWRRAKEAGFEILELDEYIAFHLAAVMRKNLVEFAGIQTIAHLLKEKAKEWSPRILAAPGGLPRFTSVVQALLAEEVPVRELHAICECYLESQHLPTHLIPEQVRGLGAVRKDLIGNTPDTPVYRLGAKFVDLITQGIWRNGQGATLALEPKPTQDALAAVRREFGEASPTSRDPVLFVEDWRMRPFVRKLVELEFPRLWVLSRREALAPDARTTLATIELT